MRILLDNCVHYGVKGFFPSHRVSHTSDVGFERLQNGELLARAKEAAFEVFVTTDKKIRHEQNLDRLPVPVVELNTLFTRLGDLTVLQPHLPAALEKSREFRFVSVAADGTLTLLAPYK